MHLGDERRLLACIGYELVEVLTQLSENEAVRPRLEMMLKDVLEEAEDAAKIAAMMEAMGTSGNRGLMTPRLSILLCSGNK